MLKPYFKVLYDEFTKPGRNSLDLILAAILAWAQVDRKTAISIVIRRKMGLMPIRSFREGLHNGLELIKQDEKKLSALSILEIMLSNSEFVCDLLDLAKEPLIRKILIDGLKQASNFKNIRLATSLINELEKRYIVRGKVVELPLPVEIKAEIREEVPKEKPIVVNMSVSLAIMGSLEKINEFADPSAFKLTTENIGLLVWHESVESNIGGNVKLHLELNATGILLEKSPEVIVKKVFSRVKGLVFLVDDFKDDQKVLDIVQTYITLSEKPLFVAIVGVQPGMIRDSVIEKIRDKCPVFLLPDKEIFVKEVGKYLYEKFYLTRSDKEEQ
ncbi:MAG: hypothetical protein Q6351_002990 [Candidatus Njordarchaeum guaymaensis]